MKNKEIYLDGAASTPLDPRVLKTMKPYLLPKHVGNSHAIHDFGIQNMLAIEKARTSISEILQCTSKEIFFCSGATEANNWIIKSIALHEIFKEKNPRLHMICGASEHASVLKACQQVEKWGIQVSYVHGSGKDGTVLAKDIKALLTSKTVLVCIMAVNNETGVKNEIEAITRLTKKNKILSLIDCTQWMSCGGNDMKLINCFPQGDFFSFSAHKIYGPTGVGCLIARSDVQKYLDAFIIGGAQERGFRGGTSNTAGIVGTAKAMELLSNENLCPQFNVLFNYLVNKLCIEQKICKLNASPIHYNIVSLNFGESLHCDNLAASLAAIGMAVSAGSACDSTHIEDQGQFNPSHVLLDLGLPENEIRNTVRVSFTKYTTISDLVQFIKGINSLIALEKIKEKSND